MLEDGCSASSEDKPMARQIGNRIGTVLQNKYRIDSLLGAGGCGRVYRATHLQLRGSVAVKFMLSTWAQYPVLRARFEREAHLLVMEYIAGRPLEGILEHYPNGVPVAVGAVHPASLRYRARRTSDVA